MLEGRRSECWRVPVNVGRSVRVSVGGNIGERVGGSVGVSFAGNVGTIVGASIAYQRLVTVYKCSIFKHSNSPHLIINHKRNSHFIL